MWSLSYTLEKISSLVPGMYNIFSTIFSIFTGSIYSMLDSFNIPDTTLDLVNDLLGGVLDYTLIDFMFGPGLYWFIIIVVCFTIIDVAKRILLV